MIAIKTKSKGKTKGQEKAKSKGKEDPSKLEAKWGKQTISIDGWTGFPNLLLERQQALQIDPVKMNILLVLMKFWWEEEKWSFPSKRTIAEIIGRDLSTVQRHIREMEESGLIVRKKRFHPTGGQNSNIYDLSGLVKRLKGFASKEATVRTKSKEDAARKRRGRVS